ncbi:hypothetical protein [Novosphingobium rosa]|nr:hypothetical protein [Novosphingobium rosa]
MEKTIVQDQLIDLGSASAETLGGDMAGTDETFGKREVGLADD